MAFSAETLKNLSANHAVLKVKASTTINKGRGVCVDASGWAIEATTSGTFMGIAMATVDNSAGVDGAKSVKVFRGLLVFANSGTVAVTQSNIGALAQIESHSVIRPFSSGVKVGRILELRDGGVNVVIDPRDRG